MKKLIKKVLIFIVPIVAIGISLEVLLINIPNEYLFKSNYLDSKSNEIEVLFLGSSHVYYGINPEYSKFKSFNAAHISQSINFDLAIIEKYKKNWSKLKYIVLPIDYFTMYTTLENKIEKWRVKNYSIYYKIHLESNYKSNFEILNDSFINNMKRLKAYYYDNLKDLTCNKLGWGTNYKSRNNSDLIKTGKVAAKRHTIINKDSVCLEKNIKILDELIEFAKTNNTKIIFFTSPAYKTYVKNLEHNQLDNTIHLITQKAAKNSNTVYYNLLNDKDFIAADFYDADHLNEKGAKKLTFILDSLIVVNEKVKRKNK